MHRQRVCFFKKFDIGDWVEAKACIGEVQTDTGEVIEVKQKLRV